MALLNTNIGPERVQVFDRPLGTVQVPGAALSTCAFLIATTQVGAPVNQAVEVVKLEDFVDQFGGADEVLFDGYYAVKGYFDNGGTGNKAIIVNVGAAPTALSFIGDAVLGTGIRALDVVDVVGLIAAPGLPLEMSYLVQPALIDYAETIRTEFGATLSTSFSLNAIPKEISKAQKDETVLTAQFQAVTGAGPWVVDVQNVASAVKAVGSVTITSYADLLEVTPDTVTVGGVIFTAQAGPVTLGDNTFQAAVDNDATAVSLAAQINAHAVASTLVDAVAVGPVVNLTAVNGGVVGNSIAIVYTDNGSVVGATVSGATLTGGVDGNVAMATVKPGMIITNAADTYKGVISAVNDTTDALTVTPNPTAAFTLGADVIVKLPSAITWKNTVINNPSRVNAWYFNPVVVLDEAQTANPGDVLVVDPIGHVAGMISRVDANTRIGGVSHAPAGIRFASLVGIQGLALTISERIDAEPLRLNFINRITEFPGSGRVVFGGYTSDNATAPLFTADEQLIQVMRTLQFIKASLEPGLRSFIWENYDAASQSQIENAILSFLRNNSYLFPVGLPESQQFRVISVEPTQNELDQGLLRVRVQVRPNKAIRFIELALEFPLPSA